MRAGRPRCWHGVLLRRIGVALGHLSPAQVCVLGRVLARIPLLNAKRSRIAARNIALCFPELSPEQRRQLVRDTVADNVIGGLDTLRAWFADTARLGDIGHVDGLEHLHDALSEGRGVVLVGAHYESVEMAMRMVAEAAPGRVRIQARRYNDPCLAHEIDAGRRRYAGRTVDKKDVTGFADAVHAGQAIIYLPDQNANRRAVFVPFYGVQTSTFAVIGSVLRRAGGRVLLLWCQRRSDGRYRVDLEPAWADWPEDDDTRTAGRYMAWVEQRSREAPSQYLWVHRRFKTRPPGEPGVYD